LELEMSAGVIGSNGRSPASIAFLVQTHRYSPLLDRLLERLEMYRRSNVFLHHDESQSALPYELIRRFKPTICQPFRRTEWSRVSQLLVELDLMQLALKKMPESEWFVLLSGNCYPIKAAHYVEEFLAQTDSDGFLDAHELSRGKAALHDWWWTRIFTRPLCRIPWISRQGRPCLRQIRIRRRSTPFSSDFRFYFGANWFILRRRAVEQLFTEDPYNHAFVRFFGEIEKKENTHTSPEEAFVQTLLHNKRDGNLDLCPDYLRYIDWTDARDWHPNTLNMRHWEHIRGSNALFARKFDYVQSRELLDKIDCELLGVTTERLTAT
jgi:Core-2/I-Branching enzyme